MLGINLLHEISCMLQTMALPFPCSGSHQAVQAISHDCISSFLTVLQAYLHPGYATDHTPIQIVDSQICILLTGLTMKPSTFSGMYIRHVLAMSLLITNHVASHFSRHVLTISWKWWSFWWRTMPMSTRVTTRAGHRCMSHHPVVTWIWQGELLAAILSW